MGNSDAAEGGGTKRILRLRSPGGRDDRRSQALWSVIVIVAVVSASYLTGWWIPRETSIDPDIEIYLIRPLIWSGVAVLASIAWIRLPERPTFHWILPVAGLLAGVFHMSALVIAGLFTGFGQTAVLTHWIDYPLTVISLGAAIVGIEMSRAHLAVSWTAMSHRVAFAFVTVLMFVAVTPPNLFTGLDDADRFFRIGAGRLLPALVLSGALTWMAARGGPSPAIAYSSTLTAFWWFFPILPDLSWLTGLLLGSIIPLVSIWLVGAIAGDTLEAPPPQTDEDQPSRRWPGWAVAGVLSCLIIGAFSGWFGVRPFAIAGTSMEPTLSAGDLVLVWERADVDALVVGDIVKVESRGKSIVHRVVSIGSDDAGIVFITQGDNVVAPDPPTRPADIDGKVVVAVPWLGMPALWMTNG